MRWPFGPPHLTLKPSKKKKEKKLNKKQRKIKTKPKKTNKEGLGPSEVALWVTSPGPKTLQKKKQKKTTKKNKKTRKKRSHQKKPAKIPQNSFSIISQIFPFFLVAFQIFPFVTPCPKKRAPKKHDKNRGFRPFFLKSRCASRNGHFWTKNQNS